MVGSAGYKLSHHAIGNVYFVPRRIGNDGLMTKNLIYQLERSPLVIVIICNAMVLF
jgi:hypothetical protein